MFCDQFIVLEIRPLNKVHLTSKTVPVLPSLDPSLMYPFHLLPSPVHPTGFLFYIFPGFLAIFILLSSNNNIIYPFDLLPSPVHPTGFSFYIFPGFLVIFILLSWNNNNTTFSTLLICMIIIINIRSVKLLNHTYKLSKY